jgi:squalene synthase HpnC
MTSTAEVVPQVAVPDLDRSSVMARASGENFPVASVLLPPRLRTHLLAIYGYARLVDEIGDREGASSPEARLAELDWAEAELDRALSGRATHPVFVAAGVTAKAIGVDRKPFVDLIEANRLDQRQSEYADFPALEEYCAKSANPVGRLVLAVFGCTTPAAVGHSDQICTALQLVEHWQDVVEDHRAGRVYLPKEDLARFEIGVEELDGPCTAALQRLMAFEAGRARSLLVEGLPLLSMLSVFGRIAVSGFCGGGLAQLDALEAARFDVFSKAVKAPKVAVARRALALALGVGRA